MVKIAFGINGDVPPAKLETVSGLGARRSIGPPAREIVMVSQNATGSLEAIARLQALPEAPKVVVLLDRAADALELAGLNVDGMVISSPRCGAFSSASRASPAANVGLIPPSGRSSCRRGS